MLIRFFVHRLVWLSLLLSVGIGALVARNLWMGREDVLQHALVANRNLSHTLAVGLQWAVTHIEQDVQDMVNLLQAVERQGHDAHIHAAFTVVGSPVLLLDAQGQGVDSVASSGQRHDYAQRDFFQALSQNGQARPDSYDSTFIGLPQTLTPEGPMVLPIARAWWAENGEFAGVVVGHLQMASLDNWLSGMVMEQGNAIGIVRQDGRLITRIPTATQPPHPQASAEHVRQFAQHTQGAFEHVSALDGVLRIHSFEHVLGTSLVVNVAQSQAEILHNWYSSVWKVAGFAFVLVAGNTWLTLLFVRELQRRRQAQHALQHERDRMQKMALHDALTGLPNRVLLQDRVEQAISQHQRDGRRVALLYLDLDGFKQVNDRWGHAAGDHVLQHIAQQLSQVVRASDTVARLGGDEFVLLLQDFDEPGLYALCQRVLHACATPCWWRDENLQPCYGVSGGISLHPQDGQQFEPLLRRADQALYRAKQAGRGYIHREGAAPVRA